MRKVVTGTFERKLKLSLLASQLSYGDIYGGGLAQSITDSLNPAFNNDVDWQGLLIRNTAIVNNQDFSMDGYFSGNNSYRLALNHYSEQGTVKGFSLDKLSPNLNLNLNPISKLNVALNLVMLFQKTHHGIGGLDFYNPFPFSTYSFPSSFAKLDPATLAIYSGNAENYDDNPVFSINANI